MMTKKSLLVLVAAVALLVFITVLLASINLDITSFFSTADDSQSPYKCKDCNVILISIDTLRADHLECYGYERNTSPNICEFAEDAILFENAISHAPSTLPSHTNIFTSLYTTEHQTEIWSYLDDSRTTLAEIMKENGYSTGAFVSGMQLKKEYNLDQGFDVYDDSSIDKPAHFINHLSLRWLDDHHDEKFFMFAHYIDVHAPYDPPAPYDTLFGPEYDGSNSLVADMNTMDDKDIVEIIRAAGYGGFGITDEEFEHLVDLYDGEIGYTDSQIGLLLDRIKELGILDRTIIILVSDHGEEFRDHGGMLHAHTLYDELLHVPLIWRYPGIEPSRIEDQVRLIDLMPTVLDSLGIPTIDEAEGVSMFSFLEGNPDRELDAYSEMFLNRSTTPLFISLRSGKYKAISNMDGKNTLLFNIENDPDELEALNKDHPASEMMVTELMNKYFSLKEGESNIMELEQDVLEELRALGYVI